MCCWLPLCIVAMLHLGEVIDASLWYPYFSIIILPINSVINPILYEPLILNYLISKPIHILRFGTLRRTLRSVTSVVERVGGSAEVVSSEAPHGETET